MERDAASHLPEHDRRDPAVSGSAGRKGGSYLRAGEEPAYGSSQKWELLFSWEEDSGMKEFWNFIQMVFMAVGGWLV